MPLYNKIYLIGFMGSGKSTAGKKLAAEIGWNFIDMDKKIEERAGKPIPEIFSEHGETYFREVETQILKDLESSENVVISTGGGAPCHSDNMSLMKKAGLTIYLRLTPSQLKSRLTNAKNERPLIKGLSGEDLLGFIEQKLSQREQVYSQAEISIDGSGVDHEKLKELIRPYLVPGL